MQPWAAWQLRDIGCGFKGPFASSKEAAAAFGSPLCPPRRHPHIHPHSTSPLKDPLTHTVYPAVDTPGVEATCQSWKKKTTSLCNCPRLLKQTIQQVILASLPLIERSQTRAVARRDLCAALRCALRRTSAENKGRIS